MRIDYEIECLPEDTPVRGNAMASGDDAFDLECENQILADQEAGNPWVWCTVKVTARCNGFRGHADLGCCNYASEEDFRTGGYYDDLKSDATDAMWNHAVQAVNRGRHASELLAQR